MLAGPLLAAAALLHGWTPLAGRGRVSTGAIAAAAPGAHSVAAEIVMERFGCTVAEATAMEAKLQKRTVRRVRAEATFGELKQRLRLSEDELKKVILRQPSVLGYSYENKLSPSLTSLQQRLSLSDAQLKKVVLSLPAVLGYS